MLFSATENARHAPRRLVETIRNITIHACSMCTRPARTRLSIHSPTHTPTHTLTRAHLHTPTPTNDDKDNEEGDDHDDYNYP